MAKNTEAYFTKQGRVINMQGNANTGGATITEYTKITDLAIDRSKIMHAKLTNVNGPVVEAGLFWDDGINPKVLLSTFLTPAASDDYLVDFPLDKASNKYLNLESGELQIGVRSSSVSHFVEIKVYVEDF